MPRVAAGGAITEGIAVRVSWRSNCNFAGAVAALTSDTFDLQHELRETWVRACDVTEVQREHCRFSPRVT